MKKGLFTILAAGLLAGGANAAQIDLQGVDGSAKATVNGTGTMNLVIITAAVDATNVSFANAFLDTNNDNADVTDATGGQAGWTYDRSAFKYPAELDEAGGNGRTLLVTATAEAADIRKNDRRQATGRAIEGRSVRQRRKPMPLPLSGRCPVELEPSGKGTARRQRFDRVIPAGLRANVGDRGRCAAQPDEHAVDRRVDVRRHHGRVARAP